MEPHVQQRDADAGRSALTSGTKITVRPSPRPRATSTSRSSATRRLVPTSCELRSTRLGTSREIPPRSTIDDRRVVDAVPREADRPRRPRVEIGQHLEGAVAEHVAPGAGAQHGLHEGPVETPSSLREIPTVTVLAWCLIASIGRVSSSIARVRAVTTSSTSAAGCADLARRALVRLDRRVRHQVAEQPRPAAPRCWPRDDRRSSRPRSASRKRSTIGGRLAAIVASISSLSDPVATARSIASRASRSGRAERIDRERRLVAEEVADHRRQHEAERRVDRRHRDRRRRRVPRARPRRRPRSASPCGRGRSRSPWRRRRRCCPATRPRTRGSAVPTTGRCASCPRWRRRRSTCSRAR